MGSTLQSGRTGLPIDSGHAVGPVFVSPDPWNAGSGRFGVITFLLFLITAGGLVYAHARFSAQPLWSVRTIEVSGNRSIATAELLDRMELRPGLPWWRAWRHQAARVRAEEPRIQSLRVAWRWPRDLTVKVRERESCLRVLSRSPLELAADGMLLAPEPALDAADLPLLTGGLPGDLRPGRELVFSAVGPDWRELLDLKERSPRIWRMISEIHYAGGSDFQVVLRDSRRMILWQPGINNDLKERLPEILADLGREHVDDAVLDLRFREQLVVRRPESALADSVPGEPSRSPQDVRSSPQRGGPKGRRRA